MLIVLPVSHIDVDAALRLATRLRDAKGLATVWLAATMQASWDVGPIVDVLRSAPQFNYYRLPDECEEGWPESANHMFYSLAQELARHENKEPWYFMEADNRPLQPCWLEALQQEYIAAGKPYMGAVNDSRLTNLQTGETFIRGKHMVGTGVYPADFLSRCKTIDTVQNFAWDVHIGPEIIHEVHDTKLIAHRFRTCNYRREGSVLVCDNFEPKPYQHLYAAPVSQEAVILHGCKDDSLDKLLRPSEFAASMPPEN